MSRQFLAARIPNSRLLYSVQSVAQGAQRIFESMGCTSMVIASMGLATLMLSSFISNVMIAGRQAGDGLAVRAGQVSFANPMKRLEGMS